MNRPAIMIIGGGPAGMSAAVAAATQGLTCTIIDEGFTLGGQIYRKPTNPERAPAPHPRGEQLRTEVAKLAQHINVRSGGSAWGIFDELRVAVTSPDEHTELLQPQALILAPGAHELVPPFPGWTLPGVMTRGAAQILTKTMGVARGRTANTLRNRYRSRSDNRAAVSGL
jgi:NADPH-dependent 2,4-dienoyl-CoA reductase/sulfur reductase-like enzyme